MRESARDFEFRQWIRMWLRAKLSGGTRHDEGLIGLLDEGLDIFHSGSSGFAPQDIEGSSESPDGRDELVVHFMGLQGASSPLPSYLVDPLHSRDERWSALREFYRIFENRIYRLLALGLVLRSSVIRTELSPIDDIQSNLDKLSGASTPASRRIRRKGFSQLAPHARSLVSLRRFLSRQLEVDRIQVEDDLFAWIPNPSPARLDGSSRLDGSCALGANLPVAGERLRIEIGPLPWKLYRTWARDARRIGERIHELMDEFLPQPMEWEAWAVLDSSGIPEGQPSVLGKSHAQAKLGKCAWLGSGEPRTGRMFLASATLASPPGSGLQLFTSVHFTR